MPERRPRRVRGTPTSARDELPFDLAAILTQLEEGLGEVDEAGRKYANARCGVYAFYDYDGEPIYVGQTSERLRVRILRHLTNQRTDAVAMSVLDPQEVAEIALYPFWELDNAREGESQSAYRARVDETLARAEYTLYQEAIAHSAFSTTLNEKGIAEKPPIDLPPPLRRRIIPPDLFARLHHPDIRIARRASTLANLAKVISERRVSPGLRQTLLTQAERLE